MFAPSLEKKECSSLHPGTGIGTCSTSNRWVGELLRSRRIPGTRGLYGLLCCSVDVGVNVGVEVLLGLFERCLGPAWGLCWKDCSPAGNFHDSGALDVS